MRIAVMVSFYNRPDLLDLCLYSLSLQLCKPDQIILLDDCSDVPPPSGYKIDMHIRRKEHKGFGKERIANRALMLTDCVYFIIVDQDCVFDNTWLALHDCYAGDADFIYSMYTSLRPEENTLVTKQTIEDRSIWKTIPRGYESEPQVWCGAGSGARVEDALAINGFDNRLGLTGTDYNFGLRLMRKGLTSDHFCKYGRYLHLWHEKPWSADKEDYRSGNKAEAIRLAALWANESIITPQGIAQLDLDEFEVRT